MPADFSTAGRTARERIPVPAVPLEIIRERSRADQRRAGMRKAILCATLAVAAVGAAAGFSSRIYDGIRVWLAGSKAAIEIRSLVTVSDPTATDLRRVVAHATFPVVLPVGLPAGSRIIRIAFAPAAHPTSLFVQYKNGRSGLSAGFLLTDSSAVNTPGLLLPSGAARPRFGEVYQWRTADQSVIVPQASGISSGDINRIEAAMANASPATSLAESETLARRIIVLGGFFEVADAAERIAPSQGESVLVDRGHLRQLASLVKNHQPMLDSRTVYLTNIPSVRGRPDFSQATLYLPKVVVIPANGVRAIASVLQSSSSPKECNCEVLFHQVDRNVYQIWKIPIAVGAPVRKYTVDLAR